MSEMNKAIISEHLSYREAVYSDTALRLGIDNYPTEAQLESMEDWALHIFEPLRKGLGDRPINISSMFRSLSLNKVIGGAETSQHMEGEAADLDNDNREEGPTNAEIFHYIRGYLIFDQLIWEYGDDENPAWVHVSYNAGKNRNEVLRCRRINGRTKYELYDRS